MKDKTSLFTRRGFHLAALLLAFFDTAVFYAIRANWVFISVNLPVPGPMGLFLIFASLVGISLLLLVLRMWEVKRKDVPLFTAKGFRVVSAVVFCLAVFVLLVMGAILLSFGYEPLTAIFLRFKKDAPAALSFLAVVLAVALLPVLKGKARATFALLLSCAVIFAGITQIFPLGSFRLTAPPAVFDTGEDYAVVFTTSANGTAFVELDGGKTTFYAEKTGRRIADRRLHAVNIPYEALEGQTYCVGSTRMIGDFSYGSRLGKTVRSASYTFTAPTGDKQTWLSVSDWHTHLKQAQKTVSYLGDYDGAILLGDPAPGLDYEDEAVVFLAEFAGKLTGGTKPVVYVRGNHETRGPFAAKLAEYLGFSRFDYTADFGPYTFVVLDSGEDKADDHVEYGGLDDFRRNRGEVVSRLEALTLSNDHIVALSHAWEVSEPEPELSARAWAALDKLGVRFMISGHSHRCRFLDGENDTERAFLEKHPNVDVYIDGGHRDKNFIASLLTFSPDGAAFRAVNDLGDEIMNAVLPWTKTE